MNARPADQLQRVAASDKGMIATAHAGATNAAVEVLDEGGNAVDAAVAAAFALGVCEPHASGLGGQTMMILRHSESRKTVALDGSSRVPSRAVAELVDSHSDRLRGYRATTVPSTPAVLAYAAQRYGRLPLKRLMEPAARLASEGFRVTQLHRDLQRRVEDHWRDGNAGDQYLEQGEPVTAGSLFRQPALGDTLRRIGKKGVEEFYHGEIAARIHEDMEANGGFIRRDDLAQVPWPIERRPVTCRFDGMRVMTFPPPAAGLTLVEMLNVISHFPERLRNPDTPEGAVLLAEVIRRAQLDRRDRPFDPNFYPQVEDNRMASVEYAKVVHKQVKARIDQRRSEPKRRKKQPAKRDGVAPTVASETGVDTGGDLKGDTTHLSVMDGDGNGVGLTQSIERVYGSFVVTPDLGFLYNNYMSAFEYEDITHPYYLRPSGVPWASVTPTIVLKGRRPWAVLGSPGSDRIASVVMQVLMRMQRQSPLDSVIAPRIHSTARGRVSLEASWMRDDIPPALEKRGFTVDAREAFSFYMGCVQLVVRSGKVFVGVADPRRDGTAGAPQ